MSGLGVRCLQSGCRFEAVWHPLFVLDVPGRTTPLTQPALGSYCSKHRLALPKSKVLNDKEWHFLRTSLEIPKDMRGVIRIGWMGAAGLVEWFDARDRKFASALSNMHARIREERGLHLVKDAP